MPSTKVGLEIDGNAVSGLITWGLDRIVGTTDLHADPGTARDHVAHVRVAGSDKVAIARDADTGPVRHREAAGQVGTDQVGEDPRARSKDEDAVRRIAGDQVALVRCSEVVVAVDPDAVRVRYRSRTRTVGTDEVVVDLVADLVAALESNADSVARDQVVSNGVVRTRRLQRDPPGPAVEGPWPRRAVGRGADEVALDQVIAGRDREIREVEALKVEPANRRTVDAEAHRCAGAATGNARTEERQDIVGPIGDGDRARAAIARLGRAVEDHRIGDFQRGGERDLMGPGAGNIELDSVRTRTRETIATSRLTVGVGVGDCLAQCARTVTADLVVGGAVDGDRCRPGRAGGHQQENQAHQDLLCPAGTFRRYGTAESRRDVTARGERSEVREEST